MSMGEFEEQLNSWESNFSSLSMQSQGLPADFSDEDMAFAKELDTLFALDQEELPPYFVQTLLDSAEPRFQPLEHGLEHKTRASVFRRLNLHRRLFYSGRSSWQSLFAILPVRSALIATAALMLFMFLTVMFTAPSFATGMTILLHGARTGVKTVQIYPTGVHHSQVTQTGESAANTHPKISFQVARQQLHNWNIYWPHAVPSTYSLDNIYLYQGQEDSWADGPFIELDYTLTGAPSRGTGQLTIGEFKLQPNINVLQVVKDGAAQAIKVDPNGRAQAIYVDGQWKVHNFFHVWVYGQRSELIYQKDGIVFWIVGDQRDGLGKEALLKIANSLQALPIVHYMHLGNDSSAGSVTVLKSDIGGSFTGDVLAIFPDDNGTSTYLSLGSTDLQPSGKPLPTPAFKGLHTR